MKKCTRCMKDKEYSEFHKLQRNPTGFDYECKLCKKERSKHYWQNLGKERRIKLGTLRDYYLSIVKSTGCKACDEKSNSCLDFHHIGNKEFEIAQRQELSVSLINELSKCIVLCANCHRKYHNNEIDISHIKPIVPMSLETFSNYLFEKYER